MFFGINNRIFFAHKEHIPQQIHIYYQNYTDSIVNRMFYNWRWASAKTTKNYLWMDRNTQRRIISRLGIMSKWRKTF